MRPWRRDSITEKQLGFQNYTADHAHAKTKLLGARLTSRREESRSDILPY
jgi:hypothetical protein